MSKLRSYHFDAGNSSKGAVGFCARVLAHSKKEACEILASVMPEEYETGIHENDDEGRIEYWFHGALDLEDVIAACRAYRAVLGVAKGEVRS